MSLQSFLYNAVFKRTSTFMLAIVGGSFFFERAVDVTADAIFDNYNKGKLWKDIKHKYEKN
ncbi:cytochrome b-c1 complex subunit 9 [Fopius arisanus]|uniref:Complex III subunit 9 n=1 Tax=Fopius arisanus TaxID=64838 RepID=A0A9R1TC64_9HYME|nr:PREDICTED: cytochrome b-c1 complex subunit 9 [Fopius arisanus]